MSEDELDIELRPVSDVARRAIVLSALTRRLWIESIAAANAAKHEAEAYDLRGWLRTEELWHELTAAEADVLERRPGELTEDEAAAIAWQSEALSTLGWALGLIDRLGAAYPSDVATAIRALPEPWDSIAPWVRERSLRPESEITGERDLAEVLEWRIAIEPARRVASGAQLAEYTTAIDDVTREVLAAGLLPAGEADLRVSNQPLTSYAAQDLEKLSGLAEERLRALNWLCGFGDSWDRVPLDV